MTRLFSGISLFLVSIFAYALEDQAAAVQLPAPDPMPMIAFAVIFFGGIGLTVWYMWKNEKNRKQHENDPK